MNPLLERIYKTERVENADGKEINPFPQSITYEKGEAIYKLIRENGLNNTIEIGMAYGLSTLFFCQAHSDNGSGHHVAIDPFEDELWESVGLLNVRRAGLEKFLEFYDSPSHEILPRFVADKKFVDFIFIDGSHLFDYVLLDFFYADKLLRNGGYIMFDDLWMPSIRKVMAFIMENRNYELLPDWGVKIKKASLARRLVVGIRFRVRGPYCVIRKIGDDSREWQHYRDF